MKNTITLLSILGLFLAPVTLAETAEKDASEETEKKVKAEKETLTGSFKKMKDGRVTFTSDDEVKYTVVKAKIEQVGDNFDKKVTVTCKTKLSPKEEGNKLIVQINKIADAE